MRIEGERIIQGFSGGSDYAKVHIVIGSDAAFVETKCNRRIKRTSGSATWRLDLDDGKDIDFICRAMCSYCRRLIAHKLVPW